VPLTSGDELGEVAGAVFLPSPLADEEGIELASGQCVAAGIQAPLL